MAIAIRPIPVLTGLSAERFEQMIETSKGTARTVIPETYSSAVRNMQERSRHTTIKMPKR